MSNLMFQLATMEFSSWSSAIQSNNHICERNNSSVLNQQLLFSYCEYASIDEGILLFVAIYCQFSCHLNFQSYLNKILSAFWNLFEIFFYWWKTKRSEYCWDRSKTVSSVVYKCEKMEIINRVIEIKSFFISIWKISPNEHVEIISMCVMNMKEWTIQKKCSSPKNMFSLDLCHAPIGSRMRFHFINDTNVF